MTETLLRQRRNLILVGFIILLLSFGDVDIKKVSALGIEFDFKTNLKIIYVCIWLVWFYFLYRYIVYFSFEGFEKFKKIKDLTFEESINPNIKRYIYSIYDELNEGCAFSYGSILNSGMICYGQAYIQRKDEDNNETKDLINFEIDFNNKKIVYLWRFMAMLKFVFLKPAITDYIFPFFFSFFVLIVGVLSKWPGNPLVIFT